METIQEKEGTQEIRCDYLKSLITIFEKAAARNGEHGEILKLAETKYRGDLLADVIREEKEQYSSDMGELLSEIDTLAGRVRDRLQELKERNITGLPSDELHMMEKLEKISDIITEGELQMIADAYMRSPFLQRKIAAIAEEKKMSVSLHPGFDRKIETVMQTAEAMKNFILSGDFGLAPSIYIKTAMKEADRVLVPVKKEVAGNDNT